MQIKSELRKYYLELRRSVDGKNKKDNAICSSVLCSDMYKSAENVFCYCALKDEVDTALILKKTVEAGKRLALPRCDDAQGNMSFYFIDSEKQLAKGSFGIMEPNPEVCEKAADFSGGLCIVPGVAFDENGFRLGYGKGYYDKFLIKSALFSVGLCYNICLCGSLPHEKHDVNVDCVATESGIICL